MRSALRTTAAAVAAVTALSLTACGDDGGSDDGNDTDPAFTTQPSDMSAAETTERSTTGSGTAETSAASETSGEPSPQQTAADGHSGDVEVTVTAPDSGWQNIIKTGQTTYEMTSDYASQRSATTLPAVSWKPADTLKDCSTVISYLSEDGTEIAQYRTTDCSSSSPEGSSAKNYEWLDRSPLPSQGSEVPLTVRVTVESGDGETAEGTTVITLRNPNNYRH
ncbi:hypothetical protein [Corynebacterium sp.]|uniref:hypothetical protein n=1 Tax=Corynebacterium sp. TaxID=1720 RepID=UPI003B3B5841